MQGVLQRSFSVILSHSRWKKFKPVRSLLG